ncbi:MAG: hypothetical protein DMF86_24570 [Acidobacteria bacterium]|nr:MAG: hypothetical protein DMF86_24570 [Acidobacteriota bacterium]
MLTTAGATDLAIVRNVVASSAPVMGVLLVGGTDTVCAEEAGARSSREAITIPTATDAIDSRMA